MNINSQNISEAEEVLQLASKDLIAFGKLFLPDDFMRSETPPFHYEIADTITDMEKKQVAIILPRGHGKTVMTKCDILKSFCFTKDPLFYGWVSATAKLATGNMDYVKTHIETNDRIKYSYWEYQTFVFNIIIIYRWFFIVSKNSSKLFLIIIINILFFLN